MTRDIKVSAFNGSYTVDSSQITVSTPSCTPSNDLIATPIVMGAMPASSTTAQIQGATVSTSDPDLCLSNPRDFSHTAWLTWIAPATQLVQGSQLALNKGTTLQ